MEDTYGLFKFNLVYCLVVYQLFMGYLMLQFEQNKNYISIVPMQLFF